jgi:Ser/Thr protein kinase RdoA (MazF antagonist)
MTISEWVYNFAGRMPVYSGCAWQGGNGGDGAGLWGGHIRMGQDEAERIVETHWGFSGRATRVDTEKDDTFIISAADGSRRVLKVTNPAEPITEVGFEVRLLCHVATSAEPVPVPHVYPDHANRVLIPLVDCADQTRHARLMSYVAGTPLDATDSSPAEREQVGQVLGRLRHATATFTHPAQHRVLAWDVQHLLTLRPLTVGAPDRQQRDLLEQGLARFEKISPALARLRRQVLHNDFSRSNIIIDHDAAHFVQGIIDFGDAVHTAIAVDVSTALLNQLPRRVPDDLSIDLFADGRDVLRGYLTVADLTREELSTIPYLVMGRVIGRALITLRRAALMPDNARYILRNTGPGWGQLRWFLAQTDEHLESLLLDDSSARPRTVSSTIAQTTGTDMS